jgi:mono/diheme cytochrome c family protein
MKRALVVILAFCASLAAQNLDYRPDPSWRPPDSATARVNPLAGSPDLAAGGRKLFQRHCAQCHGAAGEGLKEKKAADLQLPVVQQQSDGALFWKITNGNSRRAMPSFSGLPELQRWQIVLYLRTLASPEKADAKY